MKRVIKSNYGDIIVANIKSILSQDGIDILGIDCIYDWSKNSEDDCICVVVMIKGDWKADHLRADALISDALECDDWNTSQVGEASSDSFKAKHTYTWYK